MSSYLSIAEHVLKQAREPLSAKEIIKRAYLLDLMPHHLFGKTQHKTLGARLSTDILDNKESSRFFRTAPGKYFLRSLLNDDKISDEYKRPLIVRRRSRDIKKDRILSIDTSNFIDSHRDCSRDIVSALARRSYTYLQKGESRGNLARMSSFVLFIKEGRALSYRVGRYREGRDLFLNKRSVGFCTEVSEMDQSLFDIRDPGIASAGLKGLKEDLDLPDTVLKEAGAPNLGVASYVCVRQAGEITDILGVIKFECPEWFEPLRRRLALNEPEWIFLNNRVNHIEDYDPWSLAVITAYQAGLIH